MGYPGSGKSKYAEQISKALDIEIISQENNKNNLKKTLDKLEKKFLIEDKDVIIDGLNYDVKKRASWVSLLRSEIYNHSSSIKRKVKIVVLEMTTPLELAKHMNIIRARNYGCDLISNVVYNLYSSKYESVNLFDERIDDIKKIPFIPKFKKVSIMRKFLLKT